MENENAKLSKSEIAAIDFLIETVKEKGGKMAWPGAAAAVVGAAGTMAVAAAVTAQIRGISPSGQLDESEFNDAFRNASMQNEMTLEQLLEIRNKIQ